MTTSLRSLVFLLAGLALAGCATTGSRISRHQADFDAWPADVQARIRAGRIDVGFTPEMVRLALGEPDRRSTRTTAAGTSEVWAYFDHGPKFSFGVGLGAVNGATAYGGGVTMGNGGLLDDEVLRVVFDGGTVSAIVTRKPGK